MFATLKKWANCDGNMNFANFTFPKSYSRIALQVARKIAPCDRAIGSKSAQVTILGAWNADTLYKSIRLQSRFIHFNFCPLLFFCLLTSNTNSFGH